MLGDKARAHLWVALKADVPHNEQSDGGQWEGKPNGIQYDDRRNERSYCTRRL